MNVELNKREDACLLEYGAVDVDSHMEVRIAAVFVLLVLSAAGAILPLVAAKWKRIKLPTFFFFIAKYFGSGAIVATAFVHLLVDTSDTLTKPCLGGIWLEFPWAQAIVFMALYVIFLIDVLAHKNFQQHIRDCSCSESESNDGIEAVEDTTVGKLNGDLELDLKKQNGDTHTVDDYFSRELLMKKMLNCVILEAGVVFHSVFVGLSLAMSGTQFITLFIAICFHQFFEGMGLGTRFASIEWPKKYAYVPWLLGVVFSLATPVAMAGGLGVRKTYSVASTTGLITTGVFNAACAGVLIYSGVSELMAADFIYSEEFRDKSMKTLLLALALFTLGAFIMSFLGKWA
ncbi:Zinc-regulated transporter 1 [Candida viswanathii]|uniref:Zinc-regulated transporter 1 n=1 Tax=Candida viswanathii TaxID=5486 RepID=A0A367YNI6_9ASCO|nr:Zinc-regulated transporter 1 [Candida viswanathii]